MMVHDSEVVRGAHPGNTSVIFVGVHGNETPGIEALRAFDATRIVAGEVRFALGNPRAVAQNVRFVEANLNRMFREEGLRAQERASYEYGRAQELIPLITGAHALLDIHASNSPQSEPFCICEPHAFALAALLPAQRLVSGFDALEPGGTDGYMNRCGGKGICFEAGYIHDPASIMRATWALETFLHAQGHLAEAPVFAHQPPQELTMEELYHTQEHFIPAKTFADFEAVSKGTVIGTDGGKAVCASADGVVLFVRAREHAGEEAFLFGRPRV